jgi:hypothetical protein
MKHHFECGSAIGNKINVGHRDSYAAQHQIRIQTQAELNTCKIKAENVLALEDLACRKRVAPASSPAAPASRLRRSRRLRSTLAAAPHLLAHALITKQ